jgi:hypothetical protein
MTIALTSRIIVSPDVLFHTLDGEAVLLDLKNGKYYGLDAVGTRMWSLLAEYGRPLLVVERMLQEFDVDVERLRADVLCWIDRLSAQGLLTVEPPPLEREI